MFLKPSVANLLFYFFRCVFIDNIKEKQCHFKVYRNVYKQMTLNLKQMVLVEVISMTTIIDLFYRSSIT